MNGIDANRVQAVFNEILQEIKQPKTGMLTRDTVINNLIEQLIQHVEADHNPKHWPIEDFPDNYRSKHPQDRWEWAWLLTQAAVRDKELAGILCYLRGTGCILIRDPEYGYIIRPVIGEGAWDSAAQYDTEKRPLQDHIDLLLLLLKQLAEEKRSGRLVPERDLQQGVLGKMG